MTARALFAASLGASVAISGRCLSELGRNTGIREATLAVSGVVFYRIAIVSFKKYNIGGKLNPGISNPTLVRLITKYLLLPVHFATLPGVIVAFVINRFL